MIMTKGQKMNDVIENNLYVKKRTLIQTLMLKYSREEMTVVIDNIKNAFDAMIDLAFDYADAFMGEPWAAKTFDTTKKKALNGIETINDYARAVGMDPVFKTPETAAELIDCCKQLKKDAVEYFIYYDEDIDLDNV